MNCCDLYGDCQQSDTCPLRTGIVLPHQAEHAMRMDSHGCATEGGNFHPATPEPVQFNVFESIAIYLLLAVLGVISLGLIVAGSGAIYQFFN